MTLAPDAIFRTVLKGIPSTKGKRDGRKPVPNHTPFKSLRNNVSFVCPSLTDAVIVSEIEGRERKKKKKDLASPRIGRTKSFRASRNIFARRS